MTPAEALNNTIELARLADRLGFDRYWIAEHHAISALASPAPEILMARVAAETRGHSHRIGRRAAAALRPLKVVEGFRVLHALYPGRIDSGIGRAPGGTGLDAYALRRDRERQPPDDFPRQLIELLTFLMAAFRRSIRLAKSRFRRRCRAGPRSGCWVRVMWSASAAAQLGLPYAFAHFIDQNPTRAAIEHYRSHFIAAEKGAKPRVILALGAICAETDEEAEYLLSSSRLFRRRIRQGRFAADSDARRCDARTRRDPRARCRRRRNGRGIWSGVRRRCAGKLIDMASVLNLDELMIVTIVHSHRARMRSHELLAEAFELKPRTSFGAHAASDSGAPRFAESGG